MNLNTFNFFSVIKMKFCVIMNRKKYFNADRYKSQVFNLTSHVRDLCGREKPFVKIISPSGDITMRIYANFGNLELTSGLGVYKLKSFGRSEFNSSSHMLRASLHCVDGPVVVNQRFNSQSIKYQSTIAIQ